MLLSVSSAVDGIATLARDVASANWTALAFAAFVIGVAAWIAVEGLKTLRAKWRHDAEKER